MKTNNLKFCNYDFIKAKSIVKDFHTHNIPPQGHKFTRVIYRDRVRDELDRCNEYNLKDNFQVKDFYYPPKKYELNPLENPNIIQESDFLYYDTKKDIYIKEEDCELVIVEPKCDLIVCGIAVVGRPISRFLDDKKTLEITRVVFPNAINSVSFDPVMAKRNINHASSIPSELIADVCKQAKLKGYKKVITYTRQDEKGNYYKACGFNIVYRQKSVGLWKSKNGKKVNTKSTPCPKNRWEKIL